MHIIDSHFHWLPRSAFERLVNRKGEVLAAVNDRGAYDYWRPGGKGRRSKLWAEWFDLEKQFEYMDSLGHYVEVVSSIGPFSVHFSYLEPEEGRDAAMAWNEEMAGAQRQYPGRFRASAAVPLVDTQIALEVLDHAINDQGLMGVNVPGSIGMDPNIDAERLEPFYARVEELDIPIFLHPTDAIFAEMLGGYGGALQAGLGRVMEVSVAASRLILSGIMERHPKLRIVISHTGGALPYQSGRMDKSGKGANLPKPVSWYMKRMYTDTVSPHVLGLKFAIDYYGIDNVMYGTDYPCWDPVATLALLDQIDLSDEDKAKLFVGNALRILNLARNDPMASGTPAFVTAAQ